MDEQSIVNNLLGPNGGTFGLGILTGAIIMWLANLKMIAPYIVRAHSAEMLALGKQIALLEARISALEKTEAAYHGLLIEHSKRTLHPESVK